MSDYKELIAKLRFYTDTADDPIYGICINSPKVMLQAADVIEQLVKERDAAVDDLSMHGRYCVTCAHSTIDGAYVWPCNDKRLRCATDDNKNWEWRGVQEDNDETD